MAKIEKQTELEGDKGREREDEKGTSRVKKKRETLPFAQFARTQEQIFLDIHKSARHFKTRGPRGGSLSLSLCPSSTALRSSMILSRALTQSRSLSLFLTLSPSLNVLAHTHTHSLVSPVHSYTRGIWRGGIDEHEYQEHSPRPSRLAVILRRLRLEHSCTHIVMLLACHASIERQKQTGSGTDGCIVRP